MRTHPILHPLRDRQKDQGKLDETDPKDDDEHMCAYEPLGGNFVTILRYIVCTLYTLYTMPVFCVVADCWLARTIACGVPAFAGRVEDTMEIVVTDTPGECNTAVSWISYRQPGDRRGQSVRFQQVLSSLKGCVLFVVCGWKQK